MGAAPDSSSFGQSMRARWAVRGLTRGSGSVRRVARTSQSFASVVGRSLASRAVVRQPALSWTPRREAPTPQTRAAVAPPGASLLSVLMRVWSNVDTGGEESDGGSWPPPTLVRTLPSLAGRSSSPAAPSGGSTPTARRTTPRAPGLPRVTLKGSRTMAGPMTGPSSGSTRLTPQQVGIRQPPEVAAVGRTLTPRDQGRAPRRANRSSQPNSAGRSHPGPAGPAGSTGRFPALGAADVRSGLGRTVPKAPSAPVARSLPIFTGSAAGEAAHSSAGQSYGSQPVVRAQPLLRPGRLAAGAPLPAVLTTGGFEAGRHFRAPASLGSGHRIGAQRRLRRAGSAATVAEAQTPFRAHSTFRAQSTFQAQSGGSLSGPGPWMSSVAPLASRMLVLRRPSRDPDGAGLDEFLPDGAAARAGRPHALAPASRQTAHRGRRGESTSDNRPGDGGHAMQSVSRRTHAASRRPQTVAVRTPTSGARTPNTPRAHSLVPGRRPGSPRQFESSSSSLALARATAPLPSGGYEKSAGSLQSFGDTRIERSAISPGISPIGMALAGGLASASLGVSAATPASSLPGSPPMHAAFLPGRLIRRAARADAAGWDEDRTPAARADAARTSPGRTTAAQTSPGRTTAARTTAARTTASRTTAARTALVPTDRHQSRTGSADGTYSAGRERATGGGRAAKQGGSLPIRPSRTAGPRPAAEVGRLDDRTASRFRRAGTPGPGQTIRRTTAASRPDLVAPPGTTAMGRRYLGALRARRPDRDEPLPVQLRPLAHLVVGAPRAASVRLRTGPATTQALAEVGRPAATVGNTIHLAAPPAKSPRSAEVLAHELVHAASPSPVPRFFQDDHDTAEERQAMLTGGLVRDLASKTLERGGIASALQRRVEGSRAQHAPHLLFGTAGLKVAPGASPLTAGTMAEVAASGRPTPTAGSAATAAPTAGRGATPPGGAMPPSGSPVGGPPAAVAEANRTIHRRRAGGRHRLEPPDASLPPALARLLDRPDNFFVPGADREQRGNEDSFTDGSQGTRPGPSTRTGGPMSAPFSPPPLVEASTHPISQETLDWIVEAVEERILTELERRGLRFQPGVF